MAANSADCNTCLIENTFSDCGMFAGDTMDDAIWSYAGKDCLGATSEDRCGGPDSVIGPRRPYLERSLPWLADDSWDGNVWRWRWITWCIWDAAQVDGRRCQPKPEIGILLDFVRSDPQTLLCNDIDDINDCDRNDACKYDYQNQNDGKLTHTLGHLW
jgi:hypothetical protein